LDTFKFKSKAAFISFLSALLDVHFQSSQQHIHIPRQMDDKTRAGSYCSTPVDRRCLGIRWAYIIALNLIYGDWIYELDKKRFYLCM